MTRVRQVKRHAGLAGVLAVAWCCAASPAAAADPVLHYDVIETRSARRLYTMRGWSEDDATDPSHVVAISHLVFPQGSEATIRVTFTRDEPPRCLQWEAVVKDRHGKAVASSRERIVPDTFPLLARGLPPNTYPPVAPLGYVLTRLGLGKHERASFYFVLMTTSLLQMDLWVDGRERLHVPAGEFDSYRIRMRVNPESIFPNLPGFLQPFVRFFIPTQTLWLTASAPQRLVKFTGQMGPPGSPQLLIQLTGVENRRSE